MSFWDDCRSFFNNHSGKMSILSGLATAGGITALLFFGAPVAVPALAGVVLAIGTGLVVTTATGVNWYHVRREQVEAVTTEDRDELMERALVILTRFEERESQKNNQHQQQQQAQILEQDRQSIKLEMIDQKVDVQFYSQQQTNAQFLENQEEILTLLKKTTLGGVPPAPNHFSGNHSQFFGMPAAPSAASSASSSHSTMPSTSPAFMGQQ